MRPSFLSTSPTDVSGKSYRDPLESPIAYAPTDKESIDKDLSSARRLLSPHVLVLHLLYSRLQAARYYQPTIMFLIQQLVLRSTRNHKRFRYSSGLIYCFMLSDEYHIALTLLPANLVFHSYFLDLKPSKAHILTHIAKAYCGNHCTDSPFPGIA